MTGHVFISYQHDDESAAYVERLAAFLRTVGIEPWFDRGISAGHRWEEVIRHQVSTCSAVIVVMTPSAEQSRWIRREIAEAEALEKPVVPLLFSGERFFSLSDIQFHDVRDGRLPGSDFVDELRGLITPSAPAVRHAAVPVAPLRAAADPARPRRRSLALVLTATATAGAIAIGVTIAVATKPGNNLGAVTVDTSSSTSRSSATTPLTSTSVHSSSPSTPGPTTTSASTCAAASAAPPSGGPGTSGFVPEVSGIVVNVYTNYAISGAIVTLQDSAGHAWQVGTDGTGSFKIVSTPQKLIAAGPLAFRVDRTGFCSYRTTRNAIAGQAIVGVRLTISPS